MKATLKCREIRAIITTPDTEPYWSPPPRYLFVYEEEYPIVTWSDKNLVARAESSGFDIDLKVSIVDEVVEKSRRETKARGNHNADPKNWIVERLE